MSKWSVNITNKDKGIFRNGDCYIISVEDIQDWGNTRPLKKLEKYKET